MPSSWESIKVDGNEMNMYLSMPSGTGPFPAVVVIHHGSGVDQFSRDMSDRLAEGGFAGIVPNIFHRQDDSNNPERLSPRERLSDPETEADINATVEYLRSHSGIQGDNLGITGFCMGGRIVWLMAAANNRFKAAVPYYGGNLMVPWGVGVKRTPFDRTSEINCPILFHFGEDDVNPSPADMAKLDAELTKFGKPHQFFTYPGAAHSFMDHTNSQDYRLAAVEASWPRTLDFFAKHLK